MLSIADLYQTLDERRKTLRLSQADVGKLAMQQNDGSVLQNIRRGAAPRYDNLVAVCDVLGLELRIGPKGEPSLPPKADDKDFAQIPVHDAQLAAGDGSNNGDSQIIGHMAFRHDWLKRLGVSAATATVARVTGMSMKPTLSEGDSILIDTSHAARQVPVRSRPPGKSDMPIYAFRSNDSERVKRLLRPDADTFILFSDNPDWAPEVISGAALRRLEINILGQVVWSGHVWR